MSDRIASHHYSRVNLGLLALLLALVLASVQHSTHGLARNRFARQVLHSSEPVLSKAPWVDGLWWHTLCNSQEKHHLAASLNAVDTSAETTYLRAISAIAQGDCIRAITILSETPAVSPTAPHPIVQAYALSMLGQWAEAIERFPTTGIPSGNWLMRRYWANVLLRAGLEAGAQEPNQASALLQASDALAGIFPFDASLKLVDFLISTGREPEAFAELRYAMILLGNDIAPLSMDEYHRLAASYSAAAFSVNPNKYMSPADRISFYPVEYAWNERWKLISFDLNREDLILGPFIRAKLYWERVHPDGQAPAIIIQETVVRNMIPNAGFEWQPPAQAIRPLGFSGGLYGEKPPYPYNIITEGNDQAFCLTSNTEYESSGIITGWQSVTAHRGKLLVFGGSFRTDPQGAAYIGWRWRSETDMRLKHLVDGQTATAWTSYVDITPLPQHVNEVAFHLLRYRNQGAACFDNLFAFVLPVPPDESDKADQ